MDTAGGRQQAVNARELYEFLGSKRQFANWIKERIESYEFVENVDYVVFNNFVKNPHQSGLRSTGIGIFVV